jgi:hypothetical protein
LGLVSLLFVLGDGALQLRSFHTTCWSCALLVFGQIEECTLLTSERILLFWSGGRVHESWRPIFIKSPWLDMLFPSIALAQGMMSYFYG